jgi:hypothetical protein
MPLFGPLRGTSRQRSDEQGCLAGAPRGADQRKLEAERDELRERNSVLEQELAAAKEPAGEDAELSIFDAINFLLGLLGLEQNALNADCWADMEPDEPLRNINSIQYLIDWPQRCGPWTVEETRRLSG